jgi:hypothetical protein
LRAAASLGGQGSGTPYLWLLDIDS